MEHEEVKKDKNYIWPVVIILILLLIMGLVIYYLKFAVFLTPKADGPNLTNSISVNNSYIFASPVRASVDGDLIRVTVFLLDETGYGVFDKEVKLSNTNSSIVVNNVQSLTDDTGKAIFDISGKSAGTYFLEATVENITLPQRVKMVFY